MIFAATRFENGVQIRCEADNIVMRDDLDKPLHDTLSLEVMCKWKLKFKANNLNDKNLYKIFHFISFSDPPVVNVKPENITVNETGEFLLFCEYEANPASLKSVRW